MKWVYLVERHHAPLSIKTFECGNSRSTFNKILNINFGFDNFIHVEGNVYIGEDVQNSIATLMKERISLTKTDFLLHFKEQCYKIMKALVTTANALQKKDFIKLSNKELKQLFIYFIEMYQNAGCFVPIFPAIGNRIENILREKLKEQNIPEEKVYTLTFPKKENEVTKERRELLKIAAAMKNKGVTEIDFHIQEMIQKHLKEFSWIGIRWFLGKLITEKELFERLKYLSRMNPEQELAEIKKKKHQIEDEVNKFLPLLDKETKEFVTIAQEYVYLRTYRAEMINKAIGRVYPFIHEIGRRLGLSYQDIIYLLPEEIIDGLNEKHINKENIKERKKGFASLYINNTHSIITGKELEEFKKRADLVEKKPVETEIKGMVACEGKARGKVKIVLSINDIVKVEQGDILVAVMTFPAYISALEKASAFVTNEGGILCHAAIVSREMNKPCIIGTKIATKVLKDGDLVEVDAEKGIVRKIKPIKQ